MTICFIAIDYHRKESGGGIASYVDTVSREFIKRGHTVVIIAQSISKTSQIIEKGNLTAYLIPLGNVHYYLSKVPFLGKRVVALVRQFEWSFTIWRHFKKIARKHSIDIIEGQEVGNSLVILTFRKIPFIIKSHGAAYNFLKHSGQKVYPGDILNRLLERWCLRNAAAVVTPSESHAQEISHETGLSLQMIKVIPNPISEYFIKESSIMINPYLKKTAVLYVGRIEYRKGIVPFLRSIPYVIKEKNNVEFILAGTFHSSLPRQLATRIIEEEGISKNVKLIGHVEWEKIPQLYRDCMIFVMPSYYETFSIACIEAMVFRLPVVAAAVGSLPAIIEDGVTGLLFPFGDAKALAKAIIRLLGDSDLCRRMGEAGRKRVLAHFTVDKTVDQKLGMYQAIMARTTSPDARHY